MEIYNTTTKKLIDLSINDRKSNCDWTADLIGNTGELNYNRVECRYEMDSENIEWWSKIIDGLEKIEELTEEAKELLSPEDFEELEETLMNEGDANDYEQHVATLTNILENIIEENK